MNTKSGTGLSIVATLVLSACASGGTPYGPARTERVYPLEQESASSTAPPSQTIGGKGKGAEEVTAFRERAAPAMAPTPPPRPERPPRTPPPPRPH